jgi:RNA polymerase sigma-70 factor (ECF subfamily)
MRETRSCWFQDKEHIMDLDPDTRAALVGAMPHLHKFAMSLCRNSDQASDLTQQALLRACANIDKFEPGSNMAAWLFTILRNEYYSERRKRHREVEDVDGVYAESLTLEPNQIASLEYDELSAALVELPTDMRHALILVGWDGVGYEQAAQTCNCAIGTIKSRVHRARRRLAEVLLIDRPSGRGKTRDQTAIRSEMCRSAAATAPDRRPAR